VISIASCAVITETSCYDSEKINRRKYKKLTGKYSNDPIVFEGVSISSENGKSFTPLSLWSQLAGYNKGICADEWTVTLEFQSKKRAIAKLYQRDSLVEAKMLKGRIRKGYFYRRPYFIAIPFIPLVFGYRTYRYRLALSDKDLVVDYRWNYYAFAIAAGSSGEGQSHKTFKRLP